MSIREFVLTILALLLAMPFAWAGNNGLRGTPNLEREGMAATGDIAEASAGGSDGERLQSYRFWPNPDKLTARAQAAREGWHWNLDGQRPSLEYRMNDTEALRLRSAAGGVGLFLSVDF